MCAEPQRCSQHNLIEDRGGSIDDELAAFGNLHDSADVSRIHFRDRDRASFAQEPARPHQTVCPWRSSNCARSEPVAPAPKTKIRMACAKLYHRVHAPIDEMTGLCFGRVAWGRRSAQQALGA